MTAIGSVFPLARAEAAAGESIWQAWTGGHRHVAAFGSARAALAALLAFHAVRRLWLPSYVCATLADMPCALAWYGVDEDLTPMLPEGLRAGDAVLAIDYFGRCAGADFAGLAAARPEVLWIQDRVQALAARGPSWGDVALYSPRKLIGVAEGGLLVGDRPLPRPAAPPVRRSAAAQIARAADPEGRDPAAWYPQFQAQEAAFAVDDAAMGAEAMQALQGVAIAPLIARRRENAAVLAAGLGALALWPVPPADFAPLAVPIRVRRRDALAAALAAEGIFCARHWTGLPSDPAAFAAAHRLSGALLSLPCDHRYGPAEMARILEALGRAGATPAR